MNIPISVGSSLVLLLSIAATSTFGCVKQSTYDAVQAELTETQAALANTRQDIAQLTAQTGRLQEVNRLQEGLMLQSMEALKKEQDAETIWQKETRARVDSLTTKLNTLQQQRRWLERETEQAMAAQRELEAKAAAFMKDLDKKTGAPEPIMTPATQDLPSTVPPPTVTASAPPAPPQSTPSPSSPPTPEPPKATLPPPKPVPQPIPQDDSWFSAIKGWLGSVWRSIFS